MVGLRLLNQFKVPNLNEDTLAETVILSIGMPVGKIVHSPIFCCHSVWQIKITRQGRTIEVEGLRSFEFGVRIPAPCRVPIL